MRLSFPALISHFAPPLRGPNVRHGGSIHQEPSSGQRRTELVLLRVQAGPPARCGAALLRSGAFQG